MKFIDIFRKLVELYKISDENVKLAKRYTLLSLWDIPSKVKINVKTL